MSLIEKLQSRDEARPNFENSKDIFNKGNDGSLFKTSLSVMIETKWKREIINSNER